MSMVEDKDINLARHTKALLMPHAEAGNTEAAGWVQQTYTRSESIHNAENRRSALF